MPAPLLTITAFYQARAEQLLLPAPERAALVALSVYADTWGRCPSCRALVGRQEPERVSHARQCGRLHDDVARDPQW